MTDCIIPLDAATDVSIVGGKAVNLGELIRHGVAVPNGFVLSVGCMPTSDGYVEILEEARSRLNSPLIVRSSATIEDSLATSFAGQFESVGPVSRYDELIHAIDTVRDSVHSEKLFSYLSHYNIRSDDFNVAVVVQEYVSPVFSGVLFSRAAAGEHDDRLVIEMTDDAGGVVSGRSEPTRITVDRASKCALGGVNQEAAPPSSIVADLVSYAETIEKIFERPQDIEWVYDGTRVWIVQSRPVTAPLLQTDEVVADELSRLESQFGSHVPHFVAHQFAEGLSFATPCTVSLFQKFFSYKGSLGRVMRSYLVPIAHYKSTKYVVDVCGRLFLNKDEEQRIMFSRIPVRPVIQDSAGFSLPFYQTKWYYPGFSQLLTMTPQLFRLIFGNALFQADAYRMSTRLGRVIRYLQHTRADDEHLTLGSLRRVVDRLVTDITPFLFKVSLFQQYAFAYLEKKLRPHVSSEDWSMIVRTGIEDQILRLLKEGRNNAEILHTVSYRGFQELELSQPRWEETPERLFTLLDRLRGGTPPLSATDARSSTWSARERVIGMFPSVWDQQMLATFFKLYDRFSSYREALHDVWVREISLLRRILLHLDREARLYGSIWYQDIDTLLTKYHQLDAHQLLAERRRHETLRNVTLVEGGDIHVSTWSNVVAPPVNATDNRVFKGSALTFGRVRGVVGTRETFERGERVDILLVTHLDPAVTAYYGSIKGVITEVGGQLAHATIIAREYGVAVISLSNAHILLREVTNIEIDCELGTVTVLS